MVIDIVIIYIYLQEAGFALVAEGSRCTRLIQTPTRANPASWIYINTISITLLYCFSHHHKNTCKTFPLWTYPL